MAGPSEKEEKVESAVGTTGKKEEIVVKVKDNNNNNNVSNLHTETPPVVIPSQEVAATQTIVVPKVVITDKQPIQDTVGDDESNVNLESGNNDSEELEIEEAATKVQAAFRARQAREEFQTLKGVIKVQAVIRGHLVRRQVVATYSCIYGIVKLQALARGKITISSETRVQLQKTNTETEISETLQGSTYSWFENPTKLSMIDKLLVSSPTALPLRIGYQTALLMNLQLRLT